MRQATRTVHYATLDSVSSYSSGPLSVGDLDVLLVNLYTSASSGSPSLDVSVVDAFGNLTKVANIVPVVSHGNAACIGNGSTFVGTGSSLGTNYGVTTFGDQIQLDLVGSGTISAQISVKGK